MAERVILHDIDSRDAWACAWSARMNFTHGGEDGLGEGRGMYGSRQAITYEFGKEGSDSEWHLAVWRNSEGVHVAPVEPDEEG